MIDIHVPGDLPYVQQASYLEGGPLIWMLALYLHVNQKSVVDDDDDNDDLLIIPYQPVKFQGNSLYSF